MFQEYFRGNYSKTSKIIPIKGFGYGLNIGVIYLIKDFVLKDTWRGNELVIHNLPIAILNRNDVPYYILLSSSIFNKYKMIIDYSAEIPYLQIEAANNLYARYTLCNDIDLMFKKIKLQDAYTERIIKEANNNGNLVDGMTVFYKKTLVENDSSRPSKTSHFTK